MIHFHYKISPFWVDPKHGSNPRRKGKRFTSPFKKKGSGSKWPCGHRVNPAAK